MKGPITNCRIIGIQKISYNCKLGHLILGMWCETKVESRNYTVMFWIVNFRWKFEKKLDSLFCKLNQSKSELSATWWRWISIWSLSSSKHLSIHGNYWMRQNCLMFFFQRIFLLSSDLDQIVHARWNQQSLNSTLTWNQQKLLKEKNRAIFFIQE